MKKRRNKGSELRRMGKLDAVSHILMKKDEQNHPLIKNSKIL